MMNQSATKNRFVAFLMSCLMVFTLFGGIFHPAAENPGWGTPVAAAKDVNSLWDDISKDSIGTGLDKETTDMNTLVDKGKSIAKTITAILTLICFVAFLISIAKLATSAGNPQKRSMALTGILISGVALALFGGSWVVISFFWNILAK